MNALSLSDPIAFLVDTLTYLYMVVLLTRLILRAVGAGYRNPVVDLVAKLTNPVAVPVGRVIPPIGRFDTAALAVLVVLQAISLFLVILINGYSVDPVILVPLTLHKLLGLVLGYFFFTILVQALMSWVNPDPYHPLASVLRSINKPVLGPLQKVIPPVSGFDFSSMAALILIIFLQKLLGL
ncbi:MAG: YggT family protein [Gammaproteobacteria bacterium]